MCGDCSFKVEEYGDRRFPAGADWQDFVARAPSIPF